MKVYFFDISHLMQSDLHDENARKQVWDLTHLVSALQGLVNREEPRLFIRAITPTDDYWFEKLTSRGEWLYDAEVVKITSLDELLQIFRDEFHGAVVYPPRPYSASNVASTIAGAENLLPIRYDLSPSSLYDRLITNRRIPVIRKVSSFSGELTGSSKCDAYIWAKEKYLDSGASNPAKLGYYIDSYWLQNPFPSSVQNHTLTNHDYFISHKAFFFDLLPWDDEAPVDEPAQPVGTGQKTLQEILLSAYRRSGGDMIHVGGFVPWAFKYTTYGDAGGKHEPVPTEWRYAQILSAYNAFMDADALGIGAMANASFFQHYPLDYFYPQNPKPDWEDLRNSGLIDSTGSVVKRRYVTFYVGDYDSAAWLYSQMPRIWDDPARGSVPLGWAFNPNLEDRFPPGLAYARKTKTTNDWFIAGDSGAGYLNPGMLQTPREFSHLPSGLDTWAKHCERYYKRWDLSITGFIIDGYAPGLNDEGLLRYMRFSPDGIVAQKISEIGVFGDMPFIRMNLDLDGNPKDVARMITSRFQGEKRQFLIFRTILKTPSWHAEVRNALESGHPDTKIIDSYSFFKLMKMMLRKSPYGQI